MAWNDPFEVRINSLVDEFRQYLSTQLGLAPMEEARAAEVLYDFCMYLRKEVYQATPQDYAIYFQLHAIDDRSESEYGLMIGWIQSFAALGPRESNLGKGGDVAGLFAAFEDEAFGNGSKSQNNEETGLGGRLSAGGSLHMGDKHSSANRDKVEVSRTRRKTLTSDDFKSFQSEVMGSGVQPAVNSGMFYPPQTNSGMFYPPQSNSVSGGSGVHSRPQSGSGLLPAPQVSLNHGVENHFDPLGENSKRRSNFEINENEYGMSGMFQMGGLKSTPSNPLTAASGSYGSGEFESSAGHHVKRNPTRSPVSVESERVPEALNLTGMSKSSGVNLRKSNELDYSGDDDRVNKANLREVGSAIQYNFSAGGKSVIDDSMESAPKKAPVEAIDQRLLSGFRPYLFRNKYMINIPEPVASKYKEPVVSVGAILVSLLPAILFLVSGLCCFVLFKPLAFVFLGLAFVAFVFCVPDVLKPDNLTPNATVLSLINARNGRCYCRASRLVATSVEDAKPFFASDVWRPNLKPLMASLIHRLNGSNLPDILTVCGSETQKSLVVLFELDGGYYVVSLVRLKGGWYAVDASMELNKLSSLESGESTP